MFKKFNDKMNRNDEFRGFVHGVAFTLSGVSLYLLRRTIIIKVVANNGQ